MNIKKILVAGVAACGLCAGVALAEPHGGPGGWHGGEGMEILHSLNLTDAQKEQVHKIERAAWGQARPIMEQMHAVHEQMASALLASGAVSEETLAPMLTQEEGYRSQLDQIHLSAMVQVRALLTPEQVSQAATTHQKLEALHEQERAVLHGEDGAAP